VYLVTPHWVHPYHEFVLASAVLSHYIRSMSLPGVEIPHRFLPSRTNARRFRARPSDRRRQGGTTHLAPGASEFSWGCIAPYPLTRSAHCPQHSVSVSKPRLQPAPYRPHDHYAMIRIFPQPAGLRLLFILCSPRMLRLALTKCLEINNISRYRRCALRPPVRPHNRNRAARRTDTQITLGRRTCQSRLPREANSASC
jgi:hypothetical protein